MAGSSSPWSLPAFFSLPFLFFFASPSSTFFFGSASSPLAASTLGFFAFLGLRSRSSSLSIFTSRVHSKACSRANRRSSPSFSASRRATSARSRYIPVRLKVERSVFDSSHLTFLGGLFLLVASSWRSPTVLGHPLHIASDSQDVPLPFAAYRRRIVAYCQQYHGHMARLEIYPRPKKQKP